MAHLNYTVGGDSNLVSFKSAARVPIDSLKVHFKPIQEGTGDPSPENVRPITGWTGVEAYKTGKNLINANTVVANKRINMDGDVVGAVGDCITDYIKIVIGQKYTLTTPEGFIGNERNAYYDQNKNYLGYFPMKGLDSITYTMPDNAVYVRLTLKMASLSASQFELSSTATSYEPYTGQTIPVEFHGKNLLNIHASQSVPSPSSSTTTNRTFERGTMVVGMSPDGYYRADRVEDLTISENAISFSSSTTVTGYGIAYVINSVVPGDTIKFSYSQSSNANTWLVSFDGDGALINYQRIHSDSVTIPANASTVLLNMVTTSTDSPATYTNPQLELGSTATAYEPYNNTFYGGYVDIAKGELVQEYISASINGSAAAATWYDADIARDTIGIYCNAGIWVDFTGLPLPAGEGIFDYCATGAVYALDNEWVARFLFISGSFNRYEMRVPKSVLADTTSGTAMKESAIAYLNAHPLQAVYKLSTPITYQLTPTELSTLLSTNNIWSNANDVTEVSYAVHDSAMIRAAKRRMVMAVSNPDFLPSAYQKVEYVRGRNAAIDTGYVVKSNPTVIAKIAVNESGDRDIIGFTNNSAPSFIVDVSYNHNNTGHTNWYNRYGDTNSYSFSFQPQLGVAYEYEFGQVVKVDGEVYVTLGAYDFSTNTQSMFVFSGRTNHTDITFYSFKLYDGGELVRNLIPCYRKSDAVVGMFDLVSRSFYTSTYGELIAGPDV